MKNYTYIYQKILFLSRRHTAKTQNICTISPEVEGSKPSCYLIAVAQGKRTGTIKKRRLKFFAILSVLM